MDSLEYKELYVKIKPLLLKDSKHDLYIGIGLLVIFAALGWKGDTIDFVYCGGVLFLFFLMKSIYVKSKLPIIYDATIKEKRSKLYNRGKIVNGVKQVSYDYFLDITIHSAGTFNESGIKDTIAITENCYQIWDYDKFLKLSENDKVLVFESVSGSLLAIKTDKEFVTFEVI